jgi:hypothetical protein
LAPAPIEVTAVIRDLAVLRSGHTKRISSWDQTGRNHDALHIEQGETRTLAEMSGPGVIRHIWVTISCEDEFYLRKLLLRMYWDGMDSPSVEAPIGDFFGVGHAKVSSFSSCVLNMSANAGNDRHAAMNCYFPMPFGAGARIEVANECSTPVGAFYYYVDYDELGAPPVDQGRFHAWWRRENPCDGWMPQSYWQGGPQHREVANQPNLSDKGNYLLLEATGRGHYVGCNLSVHNLYGGWWGEGDDMFMIDGQKWPPDMHGTGSEDYFSHAWGMQVQNAYIYNGVSYHKPGTFRNYNERITVYRYHIPDPVIFHESLRVSIEHGHANKRSDDYSSVAYWYQTLPHKPFPPIPPVEQRLPRPDMNLLPVDRVGPARVKLPRAGKKAK